MRHDIQRLIDEQIGRSRTLGRLASEAARPEHLRPGPGPVITISRQIGGVGEEVAQVLSERLGFSVWDKNLIDAIADDAEVSRRLVQEFDEKTVSEIDILARTIVGEREAAAFVYPRHLIKVLISISEHGYAIILGRGANFVLPDALNVRLLSKPEVRINRLMESQHLSQKDAVDLIHHIDHERAAFVHNVFSRDINDHYAYDLFIEADCFAVKGTANIIMTALSILDQTR